MRACVRVCVCACVLHKLKCGKKLPSKLENWMLHDFKSQHIYRLLW